MIREHRHRRSLAPVVALTVLLGACAVLWIIGTVPSGGPDEPSHLVRGAAVVRGDLDGEPYDGIGVVHELPAWIGHPNPGCFALIGEQPANCATAVERPIGDRFLVTSAVNYPIWGHVPPGLATFFPASIGNELARVFDAAIPIGLFVAGLVLVARRGPLATGAAALAITPMVWFSVIVVNPSGLAIAGGFALWAGLLSADRLIAGSPDRLVAWTIAAGWAATALPRRDSIIWGALIVAVSAAAGLVDLRRLATRLGIGPWIVIAASTIATMLWAATSDTASSKLLIFTPLFPIVAVVLRHVWIRSSSMGPKVLIVACLLAGLAVTMVAAVLTRRGGYDGELLERVIGQTGLNLEEAVGLLGWLDIPLPRLVLFAWWIALGILVGAAMVRGERRGLGVGAAVVSLGIVLSWILEMSQGSATGTYWQGRYYLPFLIGVPILVAWRFPRPDGTTGREVDSLDRDRDRVIGATTLATSLIVLTVAFGASMRRWGVGNFGSHLPWKWDTYGTEVPPWVLLLVHAGVCIAVYVLWARWFATSSDRPQRLDTVAAHER